MTETTKYYKVTGEAGSAFHGGSGSWPLPKGKRPGKWWKIEGEVKPCENGLHLCRQSDLINWIGPVIWEAEARGTIIECDDKVVVSEARLIRKAGGWNETTARLFACDCAERVLKFNDDARVKDCIDVARKFARGNATDVERDAARDAARAAARYAARDAAWEAAWEAARAAARDAAWDAARAAAWAAARAAARDAARDAAWEAAWDAEQEWQAARLLQYLTGEVS